MAASAMNVVLFAPADYKPSPRAAWDAAKFINIDDTVRGGSSSSSMKIHDATCGIDFAGFLDTTTLGGAGFASQAYSENGKGFPGSALDEEKFAGLQLVIKAPRAVATTNDTGTQPGGGKHPVTKFVLNLKTEDPPKRPDGRRESSVVYEWAFNATQEGVVALEAKWDQFLPKYRGRPATDAKPLNPSQVKEFSIMARSDFAVSASGSAQRCSLPRLKGIPIQNQSGPFSLHLVSLSALPAPHFESRDFSNSTGVQNPQQISSPSGVGGSGEYYGFALFIVATVVMALWVLWALVPDRLLQRAGIDWYPNRYVRMAEDEEKGNSMI